MSRNIVQSPSLKVFKYNSKSLTYQINSCGRFLNFILRKIMIKKIPQNKPNIISGFLQFHHIVYSFCNRNFKAECQESCQIYWPTSGYDIPKEDVKKYFCTKVKSLFKF